MAFLSKPHRWQRSSLFFTHCNLKTQDSPSDSEAAVALSTVTANAKENPDGVCSTIAREKMTGVVQRRDVQYSALITLHNPFSAMLPCGYQHFIQTRAFLNTPDK
jgi:hypothetical protein